MVSSVVLFLAIKRMSSAYSKSESGSKAVCRWGGAPSFVCVSSLTSCIMTVRKSMKRYGESGQPCLIPELCLCVVEVCSPSLTWKVASVYKSFIIFK